MIRTPERLTISQEREAKIKEKYGYSEVYVFSPSFLEEYKDRIVKYFKTEAQQQFLRANMDRISEFIIGDRVKNGLSRLCCSAETIQMDLEYADITDNSFSLREGYDYIETIFIHELLHAAARQRGNDRNLTGILEHVRDENGRVVGKKNVGLNEGITQFLAEEISGHKVDDEIDSYAYNKHVVSLIADVLGKDVLLSSYFDHSTALKDLFNSLAQDENFYDDFNKRLDTINRLETTLRRINKGTITVQDPESIARMRAVAEAQKTALMESLFSKVILPQIQKIDSIKDRQEVLLPLLKKHEGILKPVAKYISKHPNSEWVLDPIISGIQQEITENGMSFDKIAQAAKKINEGLKIGPKVAKDFISAVDNFYVENQEELAADRSGKLTPLLKKQLEGMIGILDNFYAHYETLKDGPEKEETLVSIQAYESFIANHFHKIPNLQEEIEKIRQDKKTPKKEEERQDTAAPSFVEDVLEEARNQGKKRGEEDAHRSPAEQREEEKEKASRKFNLSDDFIIDNLTGAVINQENTSLYERVINITKATGECELANDPVIVEMSQKSSETYLSTTIPSLTPERIENLKRVYGEDWQEVIRKAYESGYQAGMQSELMKAQKEGLEARRENIQAIGEGRLPEEKMDKPISLREVEFIYENFDVRTKEDGEIEVIDKVTQQPVLSERTKNVAMFAAQWVRANGDTAFTQESAQVYSFISSQVSRDLTASGNINVTELTTNAEMMGPNYQKAVTALMGSSEMGAIVDTYFRMQTPNAKPKSEVQQVETPVEERTSHK